MRLADLRANLHSHPPYQRCNRFGWCYSYLNISFFYLLSKNILNNADTSVRPPPPWWQVGMTYGYHLPCGRTPSLSLHTSFMCDFDFYHLCHLLEQHKWYIEKFDFFKNFWYNIYTELRKKSILHNLYYVGVSPHTLATEIYFFGRRMVFTKSHNYQKSC